MKGDEICRDKCICRNEKYSFINASIFADLNTGGSRDKI